MFSSFCTSDVKLSIMGLCWIHLCLVLEVGGMGHGVCELWTQKVGSEPLGLVQKENACMARSLPLPEGGLPPQSQALPLLCFLRATWVVLYIVLEEAACVTAWLFLSCQKREEGSTWPQIGSYHSLLTAWVNWNFTAYGISQNIDF